MQQYKHHLAGLSVSLALAITLCGCGTAGTMETAVPTAPKTMGGHWISAASGSDENDGSSLAPFRTIAKCLSVATSGTTCNVLAGVYGETLEPTTNGVTIAGSGTSSVTVTTADPVTNWQLVGAGLYSATVAVPAAITLGAAWPGYDLFYAGVEVPQAQWPAPAADPMHPNWSSMATGSSETAYGSTTTGTIYDPN